MDHRVLISVVVPIYNAEKYIERAIESVLCQLDGRVELILVDDGSCDSSGKICDAYAVKHHDIRVIHKVNGGSSSARNAGMMVAKGEYIVFLDADDYLEPNTCQELMSVIRVYRPDCIDFGWKYINPDKEVTFNLHKLPKNVLLDKEMLRKTILPPLLHLCKDDYHFIYDFSVIKIYRRDIIRKHSVFFDEGRRTWEDRLFVSQYLKYCRNYYSMDQCFYNYVYVPGSLSQQYNVDYFRIILDSFEKYIQIYGEEYDFDTQYVNDYWCRAIETVILQSLRQTQNREVIQHTIVETLQTAQVTHWYAKRVCKDAFERKVSELVVAGKPEEAIYCYKRRVAQQRRKQATSEMGLFMKRSIRKIIRR